MVSGLVRFGANHRKKRFGVSGRGDFPRRGGHGNGLRRAGEALAEAGGQITLIRPTRTVRRILELTGLNDHLALAERSEWPP